MKKRDIVREPIKVVDQTAAASRHMKEALVKAKEKARENTTAKEESPEEYASDKITGSAETAFYSGMHLAQEAARSRRKASAKRLIEWKILKLRSLVSRQGIRLLRREERRQRSLRKNLWKKNALRKAPRVYQSLKHQYRRYPLPPLVQRLHLLLAKQLRTSRKRPRQKVKYAATERQKRTRRNSLKALCPMKRKYCFQMGALVKEPRISKTRLGHRTKSLSRAIVRCRRAQEPQSKRHKSPPRLRTRLQRTQRRPQAAPQLLQRKPHGPQLPRRKLSLLQS